MVIPEHDVDYLLVMAYLIVGGSPELHIVEEGEKTFFKVVSNCDCQVCVKQKKHEDYSMNPIAAVRYYIETYMLSSEIGKEFLNDKTQRFH